MKVSSIITIAGVGLVAAASGVAAYLYFNNDDIKKKTDKTVDDVLDVANRLSEKLKKNAEEAAQLAEEMFENNKKWTEQQWEKLTK